MMGKKCNRCDTEMQVHAGRSAHPTNWYCPFCDGLTDQEVITRLRAEVERLLVLVGWYADRADKAKQRADQLRTKLDAVTDWIAMRSGDELYQPAVDELEQLLNHE